MKSPPWTGVYSAVTTKFSSSGQLDLPAFLSSIQFQVEAGIDAIIIGGSLGESSTITHDEKIEMLESALAACGSAIPVLLNIAEGSTANAILLANRAQAAGANGLMVLPPMMYKPTEAETVRFFTDVSTNSDLPILVYNNPVDYKVEVTPDMFEELLKHPNIQAVKESTRDNNNVTRLLNRFGDRLKILSGVDTIAADALIKGAHGWVAGLVNAFPAETMAIYKLIKADRVDEALAIQNWFFPLLELDISPQLVQNVKLAEAMVGTGTEHVRLPRMKLIGSERDKVIRVINDALATRL